jgi:hypothetical protein
MDTPPYYLRNPVIAPQPILDTQIVCVNATKYNFICSNQPFSSKINNFRGDIDKKKEL